MSTTTEDRLRRALAELMAEAAELHQDAERDLESAEGMPAGRPRDEAVGAWRCRERAQGNRAWRAQKENRCRPCNQHASAAVSPAIDAGLRLQPGGRET